MFSKINEYCQYNDIYTSRQLQPPEQQIMIINFRKVS